MKIVTIKFNDANEWNFLLQLLRRLNFHFEWKEEAAPPKKEEPSPSDLVSQLYGSLPSNLTSDEFVKSLYDARVNQTREIRL
ncbi:MAG: hypothetical protein EPO28_01265 [Saprospiraceae bacterium]|nr:MAG: hypothetical protein EPO28_01265 [Saprospiraceae bacterium]